MLVPADSRSNTVRSSSRGGLALGLGRFVSGAIVVATLGCSAGSGARKAIDSGPEAPEDAAAPLSACGSPGDLGNSIGVGKFCRTALDCLKNGNADICSSILNDVSAPKATDTYFCTIACMPDAGVSQCGDDAVCSCVSLGCGCVPSRCNPTDGGAQ
jgi:hypothetical protein